MWAGAASCHIGCHLLCVREEQREISLLLFTQRAERGDVADRGRGAQHSVPLLAQNAGQAGVTKLICEQVAVVTSNTALCIIACGEL